MNRFALETKMLRSGFDAVIGCDEVGRGALAGPVVAAAVAFAKPPRAPRWWKQVADSKVLLPSHREELYTEIISAAIGWGIGVVEHSDIDRDNIHHASLAAMKIAVTQLQESVELSRPCVIIDGRFTIPDLISVEQRAVVRGDSLVHSVAAASIIAKVYRDNLMMRLHDEHPLYGFSQHKGYATKQHRSAIKAHGLSSVHRVSFCGNIL